MEFKYFTKFTEDSFKKFIDEAKQSTGYPKFAFMTYELKDDLNNITPNTSEKWLKHINFDDNKYIMSEDKVKELNYFKRIDHAEYNSSFGEDELKDYLISNNLYYENTITL